MPCIGRWVLNHLREVSGARLSDPGPEMENLVGLVCVLQTQDRPRLCIKLGQTTWDSGPWRKVCRFSYCITVSKRCKTIVDRLNADLLSNFQIKPSQKLRTRGRAWHVALVGVVSAWHGSRHFWGLLVWLRPHPRETPRRTAADLITVALLSQAEPPSSPLSRIRIISCLNWTPREHSVFQSNNRLFPALTNIMLGFLVIMQMDFESNWTFYIKYFKITMTFPSASTDVAPRILIILL